MGDTTDDLLAMAKKVAANPHRRELDMLLSAGERISMALLSLAIQELGGDAISFTGSQSGIITNDRHIDARIIEVRPFRVQDELARGKIVVVAGYQGVSYRREVTTLGRGGSDTTAVAMAAALDAEYCEICSDVDGVYSADPRIVAGARRIGMLSYEETQEMAEAGAKVLNAQAVEFAKEKGIAIYARATASPLPGTDPSTDGTVVRKLAPRMPGTVVGVASEQDVIVLDADAPPQMVLQLLDDRSVAGKQLHVYDNRVNMVISRENLHDEARFRTALADRFGDRARVIDGLAAVSAVGAGINAPTRTCGLGRRFWREGHPTFHGRNIVFQNHVDAATGPYERGSAGTPPSLHRVRTTAAALKGRRLPSWCVQNARGAAHAPVEGSGSSAPAAASAGARTAWAAPDTRLTRGDDLLP
jgi:aspartate kinase